MTHALVICHDELFEHQKRVLMSQDWLMTNLTGVLDGCDSVPGGKGVFGRTPMNPIPVSGIAGQIAYLNRLRTGSGMSFLYRRAMGTFGLINQYPVDWFELVALDGTCCEELYLDMHFSHNSTLAPSGLILLTCRIQ